MHHDTALNPRLRWFYFYSGLAVFVSALVYYVLIRTQLPWPGYHLNLQWAHAAALSDASMGGYPSLAFSLSFGLLAIAVFAPRRAMSLIAVAGVWSAGLVHEVSFGTFDTNDLLFGTLGATLALLAAIYATNSASTSAVKASDRQSNTCSAIDRGKLIAMMLVSLGFATASSEYGTGVNSNCVEEDENGICIERKKEGTAVYLSYDKLRSAVKDEAPRNLKSVSRILLYENYLFINEQNVGIHVIDNANPWSPTPVSFIVVPGNTEISIRSDYLYADSYIDLVTLDISNINDITEVAREQEVFPYNARQNIPDNVRLISVIDSNRGVVVGYK